MLPFSKKGSVAITGLNKNNIVRTIQYRVFDSPADATERKNQTFYYNKRKMGAVENLI
jgi:hypothetical protein